MAIAGYEHRWQVEAMLAALEREKASGHMNARWLADIEAQEQIFRKELARMDREGDWVEPERVVRPGPFAWVGDFGEPQVR